MSKKTKVVQEITKDDFLSLLMNYEKKTFTFLITETKVNMKKTDNPYDEIIKRTEGRYYIGGNYELRVINQMKKEGIVSSFDSLKSTKGVRVSNLLLYNEKLDKHYLSVEYFPNIPSKSKYTYQGNPIDLIMFENFLYEKSKSSRQPQEKKVLVFDYDINNIKEMSLDGIRYVVR